MSLVEQGDAGIHLSDSGDFDPGHGGSTLEKTQAIMDRIIRYNKFTLGDFLATLLDSSERLNTNAKAALSVWLSGTTAKGTRPAEIVDAIYRHKYSLKFKDKIPLTSEYKDLALPETVPSSRSHRDISFLPPLESVSGDRIPDKQRYSGREGLEEWAARAVLYRVNTEASELESLLEKSGNPTWDKLESFSLAKERQKMIHSAPVAWAVLSTVAWNCKRKSCTQEAESEDEGESDMDSDSDPESDGDTGNSTQARRKKKPKPLTGSQKSTQLGVTMSMFILMGFRNRLCGFFRTQIGMFLFGCNAPKSVYRVLCRLRVSPGHSTVLAYLRSLGASAKARLRRVGERAFGLPLGSTDSEVSGPNGGITNAQVELAGVNRIRDIAMDPGARIEAIIVYFDNINRYVVPRSTTVGNRSKLKSGTAATVVVMDKVPPGAFDRGPYMEKLVTGERKNLTVDSLYEDIDYTHLRNIGTSSILRILSKHITALRRFQKPVAKLFKDPKFGAVHPLELRKSRIYPMGTSGINEGSPGGVSDVLDDLILDQLGIPPERFDDLLLAVGGDGMTIDFLRMAMQYLEQESTAFNCRSWVIPVIQPWHMGWSYLKVLFRTHWHDQTGKEIFGLRRSTGAIGRQLNVDECEYYACLEAVETVFESLILSATRSILRRDHGGHPTVLETGKAPQLLEDLEHIFTDQGDQWTLETLLDLAGKVYDEWLTTDAYHKALSVPTSSDPTSQDLGSAILENMDSLFTGLALGTQVNSSRPTIAIRQNLPNTFPLPASILCGDQVLANMKLLMRDSFYMLEWDNSMSEGDPGRMFKIMKIFLFSFWGTNATHYGNELLEWECKFQYEYPEKLKQALMENYLVNPSGQSGHWQAGDLLQEHHNKKIKEIQNSKVGEYDDPFIRESVSLNISGLAQLEDRMFDELELTRTSKRHAAAKLKGDINVLGSHFEKERVLEFAPHRRQPYEVFDMIAAGCRRLDTGAFKSFMQRTKGGQSSVNEQDDETLT